MASNNQDVADYIRQAAIARGIDPDQAVTVAQGEGLNGYVGDNGTSFGPFQLHYGGGLGDLFTQQTGLHASNPATWQAQVDFALDQAKSGGWGPWHGWKGPAWAGINRGGPVANNDFLTDYPVAAPAGQAATAAAPTGQAAPTTAAPTVQAPPTTRLVVHPENAVPDFERDFAVAPESATQPQTGTSWQDAEALENAAAAGIPVAQHAAAPAGQGRGLLRAIVDYPGHLLSGLLQTVEYPGQVLASKTPVTSEEMIPGAVNLAGLATGTEFPRVGPIDLTSRVVQRAAPTSRAVNALVSAIGPENVPSVVSRLESNPRLSLADVSDPVRTMTQGLVDPTQPAVQNLVAQRVKDRQESLPGAVNSAYTEAMGAAPDVVKMMEGLKERAAKQLTPVAAARSSLDEILGSSVDPYQMLQQVREREANQPTAANAARSAVDEILGPSVDPYDALHAMLNRRSTAAQPLYEQALDRPVAWDNRLQQFLDDPIVQSGITKGVRIQRLESLAENKPFNPSDYAIKSFNEAGDPVIGDTPNMRTLNVMKKGLDAMVEDAKDPVTGRLSEEGRAIDKVRGAFLNKLDDINPDYKAARHAWAGPSEAHEAFNRGLNIFQNRTGSSGVNSTPQALASWARSASDAELEAAKIGASSAFRQQMMAAGDPAARAAGLANKEVNQAKLATLFGRDHAAALTHRLNSQPEDLVGAAFSRGLDVFQNRSGAAGIDTTPEALASWLKTASEGEQNAARLGARAAFDQQIKIAGDPASKVAAIANKQANQDKLGALFGKDRADQLVKRLNFEHEDPIGKAFDSGFDVLKNRSGVTGLQDRPEALQKWMQTATPEEVVAKRLGVRADIDQKIRGVKNQALAGQNITNIEYNQQKLRTLFGDKEANRLIGVMKDAQDEAATNAKLLQGSKTAETLAGREALKVRPVAYGNPLTYFTPAAAEAFGTYYGIPGLGPAVMALKGSHLGIQKVGQLSDIARNYQFARNALATGPERTATINALLSHPKVTRALKKSGNALLAPNSP